MKACELAPEEGVSRTKGWVVPDCRGRGGSILSLSTAPQPQPPDAKERPTRCWVQLTSSGTRQAERWARAIAEVPSGEEPARTRLDLALASGTELTWLLSGLAKRRHVRTAPIIQLPKGHFVGGTQSDRRPLGTQLPVKFHGSWVPNSLRAAPHTALAPV